MVNEAVITLPTPPDDEFRCPWGVVGGPPKYYGDLHGMDPVFLITPDVVAACLQPGGSEVDGIVGICDRAGMLTVVTPVGTWKYELFPAVFSDGEGPAIYLAVWPD